MAENKSFKHSLRDHLIDFLLSFFKVEIHDKNKLIEFMRVQVKALVLVMLPFTALLAIFFANQIYPAFFDSCPYTDNYLFLIMDVKVYNPASVFITYFTGTETEASDAKMALGSGFAFFLLLWGFMLFSLYKKVSFMQYEEQKQMLAQEQQAQAQAENQQHSYINSVEQTLDPNAKQEKVNG